VVSYPAPLKEKAMTDVTIYHNPACGTSNKVLARVRERGIEPTVIEYLKTPPDRATLLALIKATGEPVRALVREKAPPYAELGLEDPALTDEQLVQAMLDHPILMNRPVVVTERGTRLCRPAELVDALLPD